MKSPNFCILATGLILFFYANSLAQSDFYSDKNLVSYQKSIMRAKVDFTIDKSVYKPGENVWIVGRTEYANNPGVFPASSKVILTNGDFQKMAQVSYSNTNGVFYGNFNLPIFLEDGVYWITVMSDDEISVRERIIVRKNPLPKYILSATIENKRYSTGDNLRINVKASDYFNEALNNVKLELGFYIGSGFKKIAEGQTDKTGTFLFDVQLPKSINNNAILFQVISSQNGFAERLAGIIDSEDKNVDVKIVPLGGHMVQGLESVCYFMALNPIGYLCDIQGVVVDQTGEEVATLKSFSKGIGQFTFIPEKDKDYTIKVRQPYELSMPLDPMMIKTEGALLGTEWQKDDLYVTIDNSRTYDNLMIYGLMNGQVVFESKVRLQAQPKIKLALNEFPQGVISLALVNNGVLMSTLNVPNLKNRNDSGQIALDKGNYTTREMVNVKVDQPVVEAGDLGIVSVVAVNADWVDASYPPMPLAFKHYLAHDAGDINYITLLSLAKLSDNIDVMSSFVNMMSIEGADWQKALGQRLYSIPTTNNGGVMADVILDRLGGMNAEVIGANIVYTNNTFDPKLLVSNPNLSKDWYKAKYEAKPAYLLQLEQGSSLKEAIRTIKYYELMGNKIVFPRSQNSIMAQDGALIVLDGTKLGTEANVLDDINPSSVEKIFVSTDPMDIQRYTGLNSVGLIEITSKKGVKPDENTTEKYVTPEVMHTFETPDYSDPKQMKKKKSDFRSTLYWNGNVQIDEQGHATVVICNADIRTKVVGMVNIMSEEGYASIPFSYEVK